MKRDNTDFKHHINNAGELVTAEDINQIGKALNDIESNISEMADKDFKSHVMFTLDNSQVANSVFINDMSTPYMNFNNRSNNIVYNKDARCVTVGRSARRGTLHSTYCRSKFKSPIKTVGLLVDAHVPSGAQIKYYISVDGASYFPIKENHHDMVTLNTSGSGLFLKAEMVKNRYGETPIIYGWAMLYVDPVIEKMYKMKNFDLSRYGSAEVGDTVLIRDRHDDDKLIMIVDPDGVTELKYDKENNRLDHVLESVGDRTMKETMNYGQYFNAKGNYETVLLSTTKETVITEGEE